MHAEPPSNPVTRVDPLAWRDGALWLLDQRLLPTTESYVECATPAAVVDAIRTMVVRGAPAIGIAGAYAMVLAARDAWARAGARWREDWQTDVAAIRAARPTAVNLAWAVARMLEAAAALGAGDPVPALLARAQALHAEDLAANRRMGRLGAELIAPGAVLMTHCNAGALATAGHGTALGVIRDAHAAGRVRQVYATETRPWLQGARLTAWELAREGIPVKLVTDGAAAHVMRTQGVSWVIVGADRVAANGDVANKIGTYALAIAARAHGARLMVVAPLSTFDPATPDGAAIDIEERSAEEITTIGGSCYAPPGVGAYNPVFDVTPAALVDVLVTEAGVVERPDRARLEALRTAH
ncbi:MAG: S-methyl-5-thioribose-1-phosphate isomerase [Gammaproteobacteria bacterium]